MIIKTKKYCILLLLLNVVFFKIFSQNLVPNPSFEIKTGCPSSFGQITIATSWFSPTNHTGSVDYFHNCGSFGYKTPQNYYGNTSPKTGGGYAALILYNPSNTREYLGTQLSSPLQAGQSYCVSFSYSLTKTSGFSINRFGIYFSQNSLSAPSGNGVINVTPQLLHTQDMNVSNGWETVTFNYVATGGERYMYLGNFSDNSALTIIPTPGGTNTSSLVYIDDVSVISGATGDLDLGADTSICGGNILLDVSSSNADSYLWQDGSTSSTFNVIQAGNYWVKASFSCGDVIDSINITTSNPSQKILPNDTVLCGVDSFMLDLSGISDSLFWQDASTNKTYTAKQSGLYWAEVNSLCGTYRDSVQLNFSSLPYLNVGDSFSICENTDSIITIQSNAEIINWSSGDTGLAINVSPDNIYFVEGINTYGCLERDTLVIGLKNCTNCTPPIASVNATPNQYCDYSSCVISNKKLVINEINIKPSANNGSIYSALEIGQGEWIELYNPDSCRSSDVSGYILGSYNSFFINADQAAAQGMSFVFPNGTIIPPLGFLIVRGKNAPVPPNDVVDLVIDSTSKLCIEGGVNNSRFFLSDGDGWMGLYDNDGVPQDMISWGNATPDWDKSPCVYQNTSSNIDTLSSYTSSLIGTNLGQTIPVNQTFVRIPDGENWDVNSANATYGTCNSDCKSAPPTTNCNGTVSVTNVVGEGPFLYQWNDSEGQTSATASNLCPGWYQVKITDANGCFQVVDVEVQNDFFDISEVQLNHPNCTNAGDIKIILTDTNYQNYTFQWNPFVSSTNIATNLDSGIYEISIDNGFCTKDTTVELNLSEACCETNNLILDDTLSICLGDSLIISANSDENMVWSGTTPYQNISNHQIQVKPNNTATYYVQSIKKGQNLILNGDFENGSTGFSSDYTEDCTSNPWMMQGGYCVDNNPINHNTGWTSCGDHTTGTGNMLIVDGATTPNVKIWCQNINVKNNVDYQFSAWITTTLTNNPAVLQFSINGVSIGDVFNASATTCSWENFATKWNSNVNTSAEICIMGLSTAGGGNDFALDDISFAPICEIVDTVVVEVKNLPVVNLGPDTSYCGTFSASLNAENSGATYLWNNGKTSDTIVVNSAGEYHVIVTNNNGCSAKDSIVINTYNLPQVDLGNDTSICSGQNITFDAGAGYVNYAWTPNGEITQDITVSTANTYGVTVTDGNGCEGSDNVVLSIDTLPIINLGNDTSICSGQNITFDAGVGYVNYAWTPNGEITKDITLSTANTYGVTVTDGNGCEGSDNVVLTIDTLPIINLGNDTSICSGENITFDAGAGYSSYVWTPNGEITQDITVSTANTYGVTVTDGNGCEGSDQIVLTIDTLPIINLGNDTSICSGQNITFDAGAGYVNYAWTPNGEITQDITVSTANTYGVTVTDGNGCKGSDNVVLTIDTLPIINLGNDTSICSGQNITFDAGAGYVNYAWTPNGEITKDITVNTSNTYGVTVTDGNGCEGSDQIVLTIDTLPIINLGNDTSICADANITLNAGLGYNNYLWSTGGTNDTIIVNSAGEYNVRVINNAGCVNNDTIEITLNSLPTINLGADINICPKDSVVLNAGLGFKNYLWYPNLQTTQSIKVNKGKYTVQITDNNDCVNYDTVTIFEDSLFLSIANEFYICEDEIAELKIETKYNINSLIWDNTFNQNSLNTNQEGKHYVKGISSMGCEILDSTDVFKISYPELEFEKNSSACEGEELQIKLSTNAKNILWFNGDSNYYTHVKTPGIYEFTVRNTENDKTCAITDEIVVDFYQYPEIIDLPIQYFCFENGDSLKITIPTIANFYSLNEGRSYTSNEFNIINEGIHNVIVYNHSQCFIEQSVEIIELCPRKLYIPNAFTPNGDGKNDVFIPYSANLTHFEMYIYNRWGELLFVSNNSENGWDGTANGTVVQQDVYVYKIIVKSDLIYKEKTEEYLGTITLIK